MMRVRTRNLFVYVGETLLSSNDYNSNISKSLHSELMVLITKIISGDTRAESSAGLGIPSEDIFCSVVRMGYGKGGKNPVTELTNFYQPDRLPRNRDAISRQLSANAASPQPLLSKRSYDDLSTEPHSGYSVGLIPSGF